MPIQGIFASQCITSFHYLKNVMPIQGIFASQCIGVHILLPCESRRTDDD